MTYYFKILILAFIIPFIFSFHPKILFYKKFKILIKSIFLTSIPFILWDIIFTSYNIWGFNKLYTSSFYIINLPIEEVLFFIIIPFVCLYTHYVLEKYNISLFNVENWRLINRILSLILLIIALINFYKSYTFFCFLFCSLLMFTVEIKKIKINYNIFYTSFILLMIPFAIVNGALTGLFYDQLVVWYNNSENTGIRLFTIPIEDIIYAYQLILSNLVIFKIFQGKI
tara:strand:- start:77 stop:757 length:681 start_codon:yes stop_codon:yes gene_type:complete